MGHVLSFPDVGRKLKTLGLGLPLRIIPQNYFCFPYLLGFDRDNNAEEILPRLETLLLMVRNDELWRSLGNHLLKGRLPGLVEVRNFDTEDGLKESSGLLHWYEYSVGMSQLWFEVIHRRGLRAFNTRLALDKTYTKKLSARPSYDEGVDSGARTDRTGRCDGQY